MNKNLLRTEALQLSARNKAIRQAYHAILKATKALIATVEEEPLRYTLIREDKHKHTKELILHEMISPLIYLRLELHSNDELSIHYGWETSPVFGPYYQITSTFVRMLYKLTMASTTEINFEDAVRTDWVINNCSEAYEYIEERNKYHRFELIKHKPKPIKRKLRRVA